MGLQKGYKIGKCDDCKERKRLWEIEHASGRYCIHCAMIKCLYCSGRSIVKSCQSAKGASVKVYVKRKQTKS